MQQATQHSCPRSSLTLSSHKQNSLPSVQRSTMPKAHRTFWKSSNRSLCPLSSTRLGDAHLQLFHTVTTAFPASVSTRARRSLRLTSTPLSALKPTPLRDLAVFSKGNSAQNPLDHDMTNCARNDGRHQLPFVLKSLCLANHCIKQPLGSSHQSTLHKSLSAWLD